METAMKKKVRTKKSKSKGASALRLPYGQRIIITSEFNNWMVPIGTTGTVVNVDIEPAPNRSGGLRRASGIKDDDFWDRWEEQWIRFDGVDDRVLQIRRADLAPILERGTK
jgi:hypothetical protein